MTLDIVYITMTYLGSYIHLIVIMLALLFQLEQNFLCNKFDIYVFIGPIPLMADYTLGNDMVYYFFIDIYSS